MALLGVALPMTTARGHGAPAFAQRPGGADVEPMIARAHAALSRGDGDEALSWFTRASQFVHEPRIERGIVLAQMQTGNYRRALSFAAHVARAHPDAAGVELYATLLDVGGQPALAQRVREAPTAAAARDAGATGSTDVDVDDRASTGRTDDGERSRTAPGPWPSGEQPHEGATAVATATLVSPTLGIAPIAALPSPPARLWLRDGLGRMRAAHRAREDAATGLVLLEVPSPFGNAPRLAPRVTRVYAGSPAFAFAHVASPAATHQGAWPTMRAAFVGATVLPMGWTALRRVLASRLAGGPVLDTEGRWLGVAVPGLTTDLIVPGLEALRALAVDVPFASSKADTSADAIYEQALAGVAMVLARPTP
jgi:hypothetical protein